MNWKIVTPITTEPVTLTEVKLQRRLTSVSEGETGDEDDYLFMLIVAAREFCENHTGRALATQTIDLFLDFFPGSIQIRLPMSPLQSVTSVTYKNSVSASVVMPAADYIVDTDSDPGRIVLKYGGRWPSFTPFPVNPIVIRFVAGYTTVPKQIKNAILLLVGHWYENREAAGPVAGQIEFAVSALLSQYKLRWWD